jgi:hypothetical protein
LPKPPQLDRRPPQIDPDYFSHELFLLRYLL